MRKKRNSHEDSPLIPDELMGSLPDGWWGSETYASDMSSLGYMTRHEQDELRMMAGSRKERREIIARRKADPNEHRRDAFLLVYGSRRERKAVKERQKAREQAQKRDSRSAPPS